MKVPQILNKPGRLTNEEFEEMKKHTLIGASMLKSLGVYQNEELVKVAYQICRWHHERYNGKVNLMIINAYIFDSICDFHEQFLSHDGIFFCFIHFYIFESYCFIAIIRRFIILKNA